MPETTIGFETMTVTEWFGPTTPPEREGVYQRLAPAGPFACWNGRRWNADAHAPAEAARQTTPSRYPGAPWRGLVEPTDRPCATCGGHTVVDRGVDADSGTDLIDECPDC